MSNPYVSVLMPNYNGEKYLAEAIESVLNQSYTNFEFIIIDDCSSDNSWSIIQDYAASDERIRPFRNKKNLNVVKTRNKAFRKASSKSKYFAIFDSDDICLKDRLEKQVNFLEKNEKYGVVGSHTIIIDENANKIGLRKYPLNNKEVQSKIIRYSPLAQPATMIRKKVLEDVGYYNEDFVRVQDYELWFRIAKKYAIGNVDKALLKYRVSLEQGKNKHLKLTLKNTLIVQKKYLFTKKYFSLGGLLNFLLQHILFLLPNKLILWAFKKLRYRV